MRKQNDGWKRNEREKGGRKKTHPRRPEPLCACWKNILLPRRVKAKQRDTRKESGPSSTCRKTL